MILVKVINIPAFHFFSFRKDEIVSYMRVGKAISLNNFFNNPSSSPEYFGKEVKNLSQHLQQKLKETIPILQQDIYHYAIDYCLESAKTDTIHFKNLRKKANEIYVHLHDKYGRRIVNAKESIGDFLSRMHERELLFKDKLKIKIKNKRVIKYYANKISSFYKYNKQKER